jgi:hypothetical protein
MPDSTLLETTAEADESPAPAGRGSMRIHERAREDKGAEPPVV